MLHRLSRSSAYPSPARGLGVAVAFIEDAVDSTGDVGCVNCVAGGDCTVTSDDPSLALSFPCPLPNDCTDGDGSPEMGCPNVPVELLAFVVFTPLPMSIIIIASEADIPGIRGE
jgi:hypothetical protein